MWPVTLGNDDSCTLIKILEISGRFHHAAKYDSSVGEILELSRICFLGHGMLFKLALCHEVLGRQLATVFNVPLRSLLDTLNVYYHNFRSLGCAI